VHADPANFDDGVLKDWPRKVGTQRLNLLSG
jgi:hypothetical protein